MSISRRFFVVGGAALVSGCGAPRLGRLPGGEPLVYRPTYGQPPAQSQPVYVEPEPIYQEPTPTVQRQGPTPTSRYVDYFGSAAPGTLILNHGNREVFFIEGNGRAIAYPVAVGREGVEAPADLYTVFNKRVNPSWTPTQSMRERDPSLPVTVAGGTPQNPLGTRAIYLGINGQDSLLRFHGTNAPSSVGTAASSGCFRMYNSDVEDLYPRVSVGATVQVIRGQLFTPGIS
jgi:lipoprotein-anchoring transpeptidase ErfK/SrfK